MRFAVEKEVFDAFPGLTLGIVHAGKIDNAGDDEKIHHLLDEVQTLLKNDFTPEKLARHKLISPWRAAFEKFKRAPHHEHSSLERLMRMALGKEPLPKTNKLVDVYRYLSLKYLVPIGGDDMAHVHGDSRLAVADGTELFVSAEGEKFKEKVKKGEIIYKDNVQVLNRSWNAEECYTTLITKNTQNALLYVEGLPPVTRAEVTDITTELKSLIESLIGGSCTTRVVHAKNPAVDF